jgi:hypothetical protein
LLWKPPEPGVVVVASRDHRSGDIHLHGGESTSVPADDGVLMEPPRPTRVLVVSDHVESTPELLATMRERAAQGPVQFRLLVPNPAHAEAHLLHPERHDKAAVAERFLHDHHDEIEAAAGGRVIGSVSIRNDPYDAIEELLFNEPIDEIMLAVAPHALSHLLHQDLPHRLAHFGIPVMTVGSKHET